MKNFIGVSTCSVENSLLEFVSNLTDIKQDLQNYNNLLFSV